MSKHKKLKLNFSIEAEDVQGLYFSHGTGRFFEVKLTKKKLSGIWPVVKLKLDDGETRAVLFLHVNYFMEQGIYENIIPYGDLK